MARQLPLLDVMDIARPEFKLQKRKRQIAVSAVAVVAIAAVTIAVYRLRPAAPTVERGTVWTDSVKRGPMLRQVRGVGSLVPSQEAVLQIPAETEATVVRIRMLPGSLVKADTVLLEMSNPAVEQAAAAMGGLDGVINAAGILAETGIADTTARLNCLKELLQSQCGLWDKPARLFLDAYFARITAALGEDAAGSPPELVLNQTS